MFGHQNKVAHYTVKCRRLIDKFSFCLKNKRHDKPEYLNQGSLMVIQFR